MSQPGQSAREVETIELLGGRANGRRMTVPAGTSEVTVPVYGANGLPTYDIYRPSASRCSDGVGIWMLHRPQVKWVDSGAMPL